MISVAWAIPNTAPERLEPLRCQVLREIADEICKEYKLKFQQLISDRRERHLVIARHHFMYRATTETDKTTVQIGRFLGNRDHTTVMHGIKKYKARMGL
jgi:chromosomal replication initiation ATPase DnaA